MFVCWKLKGVPTEVQARSPPSSSMVLERLRSKLRGNTTQLDQRNIFKQVNSIKTLIGII